MEPGSPEDFLKEIPPTPEITFQKLGLRTRGLLRGSSADSPYAGLSEPARFRNALEELGGLYAAFGQFLCWRADLLPADYLGRLRHIRVPVAPVSIPDVSKTLSSELGAAGDTLAQNLERDPCWNTLARCAYRAQYHGTAVAVQVARDPIPEAAFEAFESGLRLIGEARIAEATGPATLLRFREW